MARAASAAGRSTCGAGASRSRRSRPSISRGVPRGATKSRTSGAAIRRFGESAGTALPQAIEGGAQEGLVGGAVDQEDDARERHRVEQCADLVEAAGVLGTEAAQVHQDRVAPAGEPAHGLLPGIGVAEEFGGAEAAVAVRRGVERGEPAVEVGPAAHEPARQRPRYELQELVRLDGGGGEVGAGDQREAPGAEPARRQRVEELLAAAAQREHAQQEQRGAGRRSGRRPAEPQACDHAPRRRGDRTRRDQRPGREDQPDRLRDAEEQDHRPREDGLIAQLLALVARGEATQPPPAEHGEEREAEDVQGDEDAPAAEPRREPDLGDAAEHRLVEAEDLHQHHRPDDARRDERQHERPDRADAPGEEGEQQDRLRSVGGQPEGEQVLRGERGVARQEVDAERGQRRARSTPATARRPRRPVATTRPRTMTLGHQ